MKKRLKLVFVVIFLVISGVLLYFSDSIIAFAKSMFIMEYEYDKVYKSGDEIILKQGVNNYVPYAFVGYLDKDGILLDFHSLSYNIRSGININSFYVGESCLENIKRHDPENYDSDMAIEERCDNTLIGLINYNLSEEKLRGIKSWKMIDNSYKDIRYYCTTYDINLPLCREVISEYQYGNTLYDGYPILMFQEYTIPTFEIKCNEDICKYGEKVSCQLNVDSRENLNTFRTSLSNNLFTISDIVADDGWKYRVDEEGFYVFTNESCQEGEGKIFDFSITPKKNSTTSSMLEITDFSFVTDSGYEESVNLSTNMNVEATVNNPNTGSDIRNFVIILIVILFIFVTTTMSILFSYKKKNSLNG